MADPDFPIVVSESNYIDDGGMDATRRNEVVEHECEECGYDRAEIEVRAERNRREIVSRVKCKVCNTKSFPFLPREEF